MSKRFIAIFFVICSAAWGQEFCATLAGKVTDPVGAAGAGAIISARANATGVITTATTNDEGVYQILVLNRGGCSVIAEKEGFQKSIQEGLNLQVAERETLDVRLSIGDVTQILTVEANAGVVETETAD